ncbi:hypothetical protein [Salipiger mucosus]|nr:hypothetical protein [Salipiger mucosus]
MIVSTSAHAQGFLGGDGSSNRGASESRFQQDSRSSQGGSGSGEDLPPMGEDVSLDQFDEYYDSLVNEVDDRLGQMSVTEDEEQEETLQGPDVSRTQSDLDQISKSQREIRLLQLKLERARLAKELWTELSAESIDDMRSTITSLEEELQIARQEHAQELETLETRAATAEEDLAETTADLTEAEQEIARLRQERDDALARVRQQGPAMQPTATPDPGVATSGGFTASAPRVQDIRMIGGRATAVLSYPGGVERTVSLHDELRDGSRVTAIGRTGVEVSQGDNSYMLDRGSYAGSRQQQTSRPSSESSRTRNAAPAGAPGFLGQAADNANP